MGYLDKSSVNSSSESIIRSFNYLLKLSCIMVEKINNFLNRLSIFSISYINHIFDIFDIETLEYILEYL
jgi:hypothetical protein